MTASIHFLPRRGTDRSLPADGANLGGFSPASSDFLPNRHELLPVTVKPGEASSPSPSASNSNRRALNCLLAVMQAGEDGPQPETSPARYSPWSVSQEHWWRA